jgi:hypothetical protein
MLVPILFAVVVVANILWYRAKFLLKAHGFPVSFMWHGSDLPNLYRLYQRQIDPVQRTRVLRLLIALYGSIGVSVVLVLFLGLR